MEWISWFIAGFIALYVAKKSLTLNFVESAMFILWGYVSLFTIICLEIAKRVLK